MVSGRPGPAGQRPQLQPAPRCTTALSRRPGFPLHNYVGYSQVGDAAAGDYSLHLSIDGGSASAYLPSARCPRCPAATTWSPPGSRPRPCSTPARGCGPISSTPRGNASKPVPAARPACAPPGEWTDIDLTIPGEFAEAAYLGVELELVQPSPDPRNVLGNHQIVLTDVKGDAWFDDIAVWQLPHVEISTDSAVNVTRNPRGPAWDIAVRDLVGGRLTARVTIYDHQRNVIATDRRPMGWGAPSKWRWSPKLPGYGWYLAELAVLESAAPARAAAKQSNTITFGGPAAPVVKIDADAAAPNPPEPAVENALPRRAGAGRCWPGPTTRCCGCRRAPGPSERTPSVLRWPPRT